MSASSVLLHVCCGPCSLMPVQALRQEGLDVVAYFFNPNIHPQEEYGLRLEAMRQAANLEGVPLLTEGESMEPATWVAALGKTEEERQEGVRCLSCYRVRLEATARVARARGFAAFTSSLLYSRYQRHEDIVAAAEAAAACHGVPFLYRDFRSGWQEGIDRSKEMGLYRQKWCGCILSRSEAERQREAWREARRDARQREKAARAAVRMAGQG